MKKASLFLSIMMFIMMLFPASVLAHTGLLSASPDESEKVGKPVTEIRLTFGTKIESISTIKVTDEQGTEVGVKVETDKDSMTGSFEQPLENGRYSVEWRIIGEDGHAIKDTYSFTVAVPEPEIAPTPEQEPSEDTRPSQENAANTEQTGGSEVTGDMTNETDETGDSVSNNTEVPTADQNDSSETIISSSSSSFSMSTSTIIAIAVLVLCLVIAVFGMNSIRKRNK
ncbi:copper resistance CopC family protein [Paenibacillus kobensis]|uniref:copper resistance CopC family protein n=1 Tax=Paenibacillus kobensis TaxID=59841 RepID=UPI0013E3EC25|nr:copper resistance protein CopC [Paenibacillus kobensis]